ncbi:MAG: FAD/NAD(P)-binding protein [Gammaproteobacteria bacterium]|nr:FAD/NAD(P)-binding protein [Gammaproteobacteria bacterium]
MPQTKHAENLIIGAGLVGSITAWILAQHGRTGILLERNNDPGGVERQLRRSGR